MVPHKNIFLNFTGYSVFYQLKKLSFTYVGSVFQTVRRMCVHHIIFRTTVKMLRSYMCSLSIHRRMLSSHPVPTLCRPVRLTWC